MIKKVNAFKLGLFVIVSVSLAIGAILWFGMSHLFRAEQTYVTFFEEPVQGLEKGADINFLGIKVGRVVSFGLAPDQRHVRVLMRIEKNFKVDDAMRVSPASKLLTGKSSLELSRSAEGEPSAAPDLPFDVQYPIIPPEQGGFGSIQDTIASVGNKLDGMDLAGLTDAWTQTAQRANRILSDDELQKTIDNLRAASENIEKFSRVLGRSETRNQWESLFQSASAAAASAEKASESLAGQLDAIPPKRLADLTDRMQNIEKEIAETVDSLNDEVGPNLALFRQTVLEAQKLLAELEGLVGQLRKEPGQILTQPEKGGEPFKR